ncbi:hypothetical protein [Streptomyces cyaneofuscatus]|uniref:hypothetical protein n=1 Tax=Streptomyces cyaneofuscatus TaxID=66883 RepID=UPI00343A344E
MAIGALSPEVAGVDGTVAVQSQARPPADLAWDSAPAKVAGASTAVGRGPDMGWDFAPTEKDRA